MRNKKIKKKIKKKTKRKSFCGLEGRAWSRGPCIQLYAKAFGVETGPGQLAPEIRGSALVGVGLSFAATAEPLGSKRAGTSGS